MTRDEAIKYIENYTWSKTKLGLSRTRDLLAGIGDPQKKLRFVHVAGSNGKGSTCAMLSRILAASGLKVGFYSSPYIQDFCERIQIVSRDDAPNTLDKAKARPSNTYSQNIPSERLGDVTSKIRVVAENMSDHPSQFELVTAIGLQYFLEEACDVVVLEVGMGGEFDSTNVIDSPDACIITNIGLEHTEYLGNTIEEIARTKGGIIKAGAEVICYDSTPEAVSIIREMSGAVGANFHLVDFEKIKASGTRISAYQDFTYKDISYRINLLGTHQLKNATVAIETARALACRGGIYEGVTTETIKQGLAEATWPARFEILCEEPLFILDGGHNPQCAMALAESLESLFPGEKFVFVAGILADKKYDEVIEILRPFASAFACLTPDNPRALCARELAETLEAKGISARAFETANPVRSAIEYASGLASSNGSAGVVAFGSLYMAGRIREEFIPTSKY